MGELNPISLKNFARTLPIATQVAWRKTSTHINIKPLPTPQPTHIKPKKKSIAPNNLINNFNFLLTSINWSINNQPYNNKPENKKIGSRIDGK
jgi:hypothetical protein